MVDRISGKDRTVGPFAAKLRKEGAAVSAHQNQNALPSAHAILELEARLRAVLSAPIAEQDVKRTLVLSIIDSFGYDFSNPTVKESLIEHVLQKFKEHGELGLKMSVLVEELRK